MNFFTDFLEGYAKMLERSDSILETVLIYLGFLIYVVAVGTVLFVALILLILLAHTWWYSLQDGAAVVPAVVELMPPVADVVIPPAGAEQEARVIHRRRVHG